MVPKIFLSLTVVLGLMSFTITIKKLASKRKQPRSKKKKIKKKSLIKGWWEELVIELDMDGLKRRTNLIQKLHKHVQLQIKELQTM